jgi:hypothetical protein
LRGRPSSTGYRPVPQWLDVGCGTGAFTGLITERCASAEVQGVDPSEGQLAITEPMSATLSHSETPNSSLASGFEHSSFKRLVRSRAVQGHKLKRRVVAFARVEGSGQQHLALSRRRTERGPKNAVRLVAVLEHTLPPSQLTIDGKNEPRQRWPPVCSRQNLDATHGTHPGCQPCGSGDAGVTPTLSARRRPLHRRLVESEKTTASRSDRPNSNISLSRVALTGHVKPSRIPRALRRAALADDCSST